VHNTNINFYYKVSNDKSQLITSWHNSSWE